MSARWIVILGLAVLPLAAAAGPLLFKFDSRVSKRTASPRFTGESIPEPPAQRKAWIARSSTLPESYITATRMLFDLGLADPRECEYREIAVGTGSVMIGDRGVATTRG